MTKTELAEQAGMGANNLSRVMSPDYGKQTISSLKRIAEALDVALVVRFVPFSQYIDWLSGTPHLDEGLRPASLAVPSFEDEETKQVFEAKTEYWEVHNRKMIPVHSVTTNAQKDLWPIIENGNAEIHPTEFGCSTPIGQNVTQQFLAQERAS